MTSPKRARVAPGTGAEFDDAGAPPPLGMPAFRAAEASLDRYDAFGETGFVAVRVRPLSTFSIDVDTASYSNLRRFLHEGTKPPRGAVRIEEMLNYFRYPETAALTQSDAPPIALESELFDAPWQRDHRLLRVGVAGRSLPTTALPPRNLERLSAGGPTAGRRASCSPIRSRVATSIPRASTASSSRPTATSTSA